MDDGDRAEESHYRRIDDVHANDIMMFSWTALNE